MAFQAGSNHYVGFYVGQTGLVTSDFTVDVFTVNGSLVDVATSSSLAMAEVGGGYYFATYIPSTAGRYFLGFTYLTFHIADCEEMLDSPAVVELTQNTGGTNALRPTLPKTSGAVGTTLSQYLLMVFQASDWKVGRTDNSFAFAITQLDDSGNWLSSPLAVSPGTYTILIRNNSGLTMVIQPNLEV